MEEAIRLKEAGKVEEIITVSIGPAQAAETIRTALAMVCRPRHSGEGGRDRGTAFGRQDLKGVVDAEKPELLVLGKQAIDNDANQTG